MSYKPDLSHATTIRCSKKSRDRIARVCERNDLSESEVIRYLLEAGLNVAERNGIGALMEARTTAKIIAHPAATKPKPPKRKKSG